MRGPSMFMGGSAIALMLLVAPDAGAGATAPLSDLVALPGPVALKVPSTVTPVPGLVMTTNEHGKTTWHDLVAATGRGYCLAQKENGYRWMGSYGSSASAPTEDLELDRLIDRGRSVVLERTRVHYDPPSGTVTATGRSDVELKEIARTPAGVVVWAFRDGSAVVVLARRVEGGVESRQIGGTAGGVPFVSVDGCPFGGARLDTRRPEAGALAQLTGSLPAQGTGKDKTTPRFVVDVSLSRVARDPEPLLAVRVRMHE